MRLPLSWMRDYVDPGLSPEDLAARLTAASAPVEAIHRRGVPDDDGNLDAYRVGLVLEAVPHPDADRLRVCRVDVGGAEPPRQIVCGAPNVAAGQTVAVALPGAVLADGTPLTERRLRGVQSQGMILSETEVDLGSEGGGIMVLDDALPPGSPLADALPLADAVLEVELTPNRPDLMAIHGLAREVHAITGAPLAPLDDAEPPEDGPGRVGDLVGLRVEAPDLCPRYMARALVDVRVAPSPLWLRARLEAAGMRAISNVVDVTNYVMLLTGQPLHAFDLDRLAGPEIVVRRAREGEPVTTLDGQRRVLDPSMLAICDAERPAVIAGIMGSADAEVGPDTTRVLLEAATFAGPSIIATSLALGLRSESSSRFEKGLPVELPPPAMAMACRMLVELCGARLVPGVLDVHVPIPDRSPIALRPARVRRLLGIDVPAAEAAESLRRLGCAVDEGPDAMRVDVPMERSGDLQREVDLIEEVARLHGLERIPAELPRTPPHAGRTPAQALRVRLGRLACDLGLSEAIAYRMVPAADLDRLRLPADDPRRDLVRIGNPLSEEMAVMRRSLLPGLLRAVAWNQAHQRPDGALFEIGRTYAPRADGLADEPEVLAAVLFGAPGEPHWRVRGAPADLWAATGLAAALARGAGVRLQPGPGAAEPYGHPARQARLVAGGAVVGWAGEVHPLALRALDVRPPVAALELDLAAMERAQGGPAQFAEVGSTPASSRDLALVVDQAVPAADVLAVAGEAGRPLVREVRVFDRYVGDPVPPGRVSLAVRLTLADPEGTLTDPRIDAQVDGVVAALRERLGAELRA